MPESILGSGMLESSEDASHPTRCLGRRTAALAPACAERRAGYHWTPAVVLEWVHRLFVLRLDAR